MKEYKTSPLKYLEYLIVLLLMNFFKLFPFQIRCKITESFTLLLYYLIKSKRNLVYTNIKYAFPEKPEEWHRKITRENYIYMGRLISEFIQTPKLNTKFLDKWNIFLPSKEEFKKTIDQGGIIITAHFASWEWIAATVALLGGVNCYTFVKRQSNYWVDQYIAKIRRKVKILYFYSDQNPKAGVRILKENQILGFCADQHAGGAGEYLPFFNRLASAFKGPAVFARLSKTKNIFFEWAYHDEKKRQVYHLERFLPPDFDFQEDPVRWEKEFTYRWVKKVEEKIKEHPVDYFWIHNRWKGIPKEDPKLIWAYWEQYEKNKN